MSNVAPILAEALHVVPRAVDLFLAYLKAEGVRVVFGIPGGLLYPLFEAIEEDAELLLVVTKHEEGAAFMADGYARVSRRLSVCAATSGPGATNLMTGVACAFADGVPMLVVTGQAASHALGKGADARAAAYLECLLPDGRTVWGVGIDEDVATASVRAILSAANAAMAANA